MTFERLQCPSFSLLYPLGSDLDQLRVNAQFFSQRSPLLGGNQTEGRNLLLQKNWTARQGNAPLPTLLCTAISWPVFMH